MPALTREEADLELLLFESEADSTTDSDLFVWLDALGLPVEVNLKLQWLIGETRKIGDKVISVGKIVLMKIRQFIEENHNLAIGAAIGAAIAVLLGGIPLLGPLLGPIAVVLGMTTGSMIDRMNKGEEVQLTWHPVHVTKEIMEIAKKFFGFVIDILRTVFREYTKNDEEKDLNNE